MFKFDLIATVLLTIIMPLADSVVDGPWSLLVQLPAFAALCWFLWHLVSKAIPAQQERFTKTLDGMAERHERWENDRHGDSERLTECLTQLRENCAANIARRNDDH